jgi:YegS/Rv2252/BmrU family lipid kinase
VTRRFLLLVNPTAGGGRSLKRLPEAEAELARLEVAHRMVPTRDIEHARSEAAVAAAQGDTVIAVGGDGLLRPLAGVLRDTAGRLAVVPAGRGNDFARVLGIPSDPAEAVRVAVEGEERRLDVAAVDGEPYLGIASYGFDSDANRIANEARLIKGNMVYLYAALKALAGWKDASFTVTVDGKRHEITGYSVAVANSKAYGGGMFMAPHAELDDGRLDVVAIGRASKLTFLARLPKVFKGTHLEVENVTVLKGTEIEVDADRPFTIYADGDPIGTVPAKVTVSQGCLGVMVPRP